MSTAPESHPFLERPHRTVALLSFPVLVSLIAEPVTGLVDTAFVKELGATALAALGVGSIVLSSAFWIFNFLAISTQTEVARAAGEGRLDRGREVCGLALVLALALGAAMTAGGQALADVANRAMGARDLLLVDANLYLRIRLFGAPAVMLTMVAFGALRGLQDMRTPLFIAVGINALNIVLDWILIFGAGPVPAFGIAGAAWASVASQWTGCAWALIAVRRRLGFPAAIRADDARRLLSVGGDMFVRTGLLTGFLLLAGRTATRVGEDAGAAHQAIRQVWFFTALLLDAYAATAQSLVGYFLGAGRPAAVRRVVRVTIGWGVATGLLLGGTMFVAAPAVAAALVPPSAQAVFAGAWLVAAIPQPLIAVSFVTDGILWGSRDYRFLRNAMLACTAAGAAGLMLIDVDSVRALEWIWGVTGAWLVGRAAFGLTKSLGL